jgi:hypothetical protein
MSDPPKKMAPKSAKKNQCRNNYTPETIADWKRESELFKTRLTDDIDTTIIFECLQLACASSFCYSQASQEGRRSQKEWDHHQHFNSSCMCICIQWESSSFRRIIIESKEVRDSSHDHWKRSIIWLLRFCVMRARASSSMENRFLPVHPHFLRDKEWH